MTTQLKETERHIELLRDQIREIDDELKYEEDVLTEEYHRKLEEMREEKYAQQNEISEEIEGLENKLEVILIVDRMETIKNLADIYSDSDVFSDVYQKELNDCEEELILIGLNQKEDL